jgi:hypothetical protein
MNRRLAPLAIFCCDRVELLSKLIFSLKKNNFSKNTIVYFFVDLSLNTDSRIQILKIIKSINFFKKKIIIKRNKKYGLKKNILDGINRIFYKHKTVIVLEDDLEVANNFLEYMNKLLNYFENNNSIYTISGFSFINFDKFNFLKKKNFISLKRPSSWGWATWKSKWILLQKNKNRKYNNSIYGNDLILMSVKNSINQLNSWAFEWSIAHILNEKYCLYPKYSLVKNNGHDKFSSNNFFKIKRKESKLKNFRLNSYEYVKENEIMKNEIKIYYNQFFLLYIIKLFFFKISYFLRKNLNI